MRNGSQKAKVNIAVWCSRKREKEREPPFQVNRVLFSTKAIALAGAPHKPVRAGFIHKMHRVSVTLHVIGRSRCNELRGATTVNRQSGG